MNGPDCPCTATAVSFTTEGHYCLAHAPRRLLFAPGRRDAPGDDLWVPVVVLAESRVFGRNMLTVTPLGGAGQRTVNAANTRPLDS